MNHHISSAHFPPAETDVSQQTIKLTVENLQKQKTSLTIHYLMLAVLNYLKQLDYWSCALAVSSQKHSHTENSGCETKCGKVASGTCNQVLHQSAILDSS